MAVAAALAEYPDVPCYVFNEIYRWRYLLAQDPLSTSQVRNLKKSSPVPSHNSKKIHQFPAQPCNSWDFVRLCPQTTGRVLQ